MTDNIEQRVAAFVEEQQREGVPLRLLIGEMMGTVMRFMIDRDGSSMTAATFSAFAALLDESQPAGRA